VRESYVNLIPTVAGGTHEAACATACSGRQELHRAACAAAQGREADARGRVCARQLRAEAKVLDPQFQGQIKERLNSRDAVRLVSSYVRPALELWLNQHVDYGKKLAELVIKARRRRASAPARRSKSARARAWPCCPAS
jgi:topoisomerase-4 subunit B